MVEGYRIPGHRLGSIIASPELLEQINTVADCMQVSSHTPKHLSTKLQICAPRPPQLALASVLSSLRQDLVDTARSSISRLHIFEEIISRLEGWQVSSMGGYYAYVLFPSAYTDAKALNKNGKVGSEEVAKYLAMELGVVCLPGSFFMPDFKDGVWADIEEAGGRELRADRWLRCVSISFLPLAEKALMTDSQLPT